MKIYFDTNVLLGLYIYPKDKAEKLIDVLENNFEIIIPERVYIEFDKNKKSYLKGNNKTNLAKQLKEEVNTSIAGIKKSVESLERKNRFKRFNTNYFDIILEIKTYLKKQFELLDNEVKNCEDEYLDNEFTEEDDTISIFVENCRSDFKTNIKTKIELLALFDARVKSKIPPGLSDSNKDDKKDPFARAGDFFIWREILEAAKDYNGEIVFVTNEKKADFWEGDSSSKFNSFLLEEFNEYAGKECTFIPLSFDKFLAEYVFDLIDDIELLGFFQERRRIYNEILNHKDYLKVIEDEYSYYFDEKILNFDLYQCICGGNIEELEDIELDEVRLISDFEDVDINIHYAANLIEASVELELTLKANAKVYICRDFDKEYIYENYPVNLLVTVDATVFYYFDDKDFDINNIMLESILSSKVTEFDVDVDESYLNEIYEENEHCVECSCEITEANYGDGTLCINCLTKD